MGGDSRWSPQTPQQCHYHVTLPRLSIALGESVDSFFFFCLERISLHDPSRSAVAQSQLTAASNSRAQVILLPRAPKA